MKKDRRDFLKIMTSGAIAASLIPLYASGEETKQKPDAEEGSQKNRVEEALALMHEYGSCCSGVFAAYAPELGMEKALAGRAGRGMAGGIGGLGNVCGAVSGAVLVIGLSKTKEGTAQDVKASYETMDTVKEFIDTFEEQHSSIKCRELIGYDISTQEKSLAAMKENAFVNCPKFIASAVTILDDILKNQKL